MEKIYKIVFISLLILSGLSISASASNVTLKPENFHYLANIQDNIVNEKLHRLDLPAEILEVSENKLADIRLFSDKNKPIPFNIVNDYTPEGESYSYPLKITEFSENEQFVVITLKFEPEQFSEVKDISYLYINTEDRNFHKQVELFGKNENSSWKLLKQDSIYDFSDQVELQKKYIKFPADKHMYYQLKLTNKQNIKYKDQSLQLQYDKLKLSLNNSKNSQIKIDSFFAKTEAKQKEIKNYHSRAFDSFINKLDKSGNTNIIVNAGLPFEQVVFDCKNTFYARKIDIFYSETGKPDSYKFLHKANIYKLSLTDIKKKINYIKYTSAKHKYYKFIIYNQDDSPLEIESITFKWIKKIMIFPGSSENKADLLVIGNSDVSKPVYDFSRIINQDNWFAQTYKLVNVSDIRKNPKFREIPADSNTIVQKNIFILIIAVVVIILSIWIFKLAKELKPQQ